MHATVSTAITAVRMAANIMCGGSCPKPSVSAPACSCPSPAVWLLPPLENMEIMNDTRTACGKYPVRFARALRLNSELLNCSIYTSCLMVSC